MIIALIIAAAFLILYKNYMENDAVGLEQEKIEIEKNNLKECCNYYQEGELKTCSVLERFSCDLCNFRCLS